MEIVFEILFALLQFVGEVVLQIILEALAELGIRSIGEPFRRPKPLHPVMAGIGYAILGAVAGAFSLWLFPSLFIDSPALRVVSLVLTPIAAGAAMAAIGAWRRKHGEELIRLDRFAYGFLFAFTMALVRFAGGH